jgi:hypothetical protein
MRLQEFRETLEKLIPNPPSWLFVCDGSPFDCKIFLIGANPARTTSSPFWKTYWTDEMGLNKKIDGRTFGGISESQAKPSDCEFCGYALARAKNELKAEV